MESDLNTKDLIDAYTGYYDSGNFFIHPNSLYRAPFMNSNGSYILYDKMPDEIFNRKSKHNHSSIASSLNRMRKQYMDLLMAYIGILMHQLRGKRCLDIDILNLPEGWDWEENQ